MVTLLHIRLFSRLEERTINSASSLTLGTRALRIFKSYFFDEFSEKLIKEIFSQYNRLRNGEEVRKDVLSSAIEIFSVLGLAKAKPVKDKNNIKWQGNLSFDLYIKEFHPKFID